MSGGSFLPILFIAIYLFAIWGAGMGSKWVGLSPIVAEIAVGVTLGPNVLGFVPSDYAQCAANDKYTCDDMAWLQTWVTDNCGQIRSHCRQPCDAASFSAQNNRTSCEAVDACEQCLSACEFARDEDCLQTPDMFSMLGHAGVALIIFESGMHFDLKEIKVVGPPGLLVALIGTLLPIAAGVGLTYALSSYLAEPDLLRAAFAAGVSLAPTSTGIALKLLLENGSLQTRFGQIIIAGAFLDDIFSILAFQILNNVYDVDGNILLATLKIGGGIMFIIIGAAFGTTLFPIAVHWLLAKVKDNQDASFQPRDNLLLVIMIVLLGLYSSLTSYIGSHLWGCFVAGMSFANIRRAHYIWINQTKRITKWLLRMFFAGSIAFSIPFKQLIDPTAIGFGFIMGMIGCVVTKLMAGMFMGESKWVIGWAMCGRAEFAYLIAGAARSKGYMGPKLYVIIIWALLWATTLAPIFFSISLKRINTRRQKEVVGKTNDDEKSLQICIGAASHIRFRVLIVKNLHDEDFDHEIHTFLHEEHLTVTSVDVRRDEDNFFGMFGVRARNVVVDVDFLTYLRNRFFKVFSDSELHVVFLPDIPDADKEFEMIKVYVVSNSDPQFLSTALARMESAGLCVVQSSCELHHPIFINGLSFFPQQGEYVLSAVCQPALSSASPSTMVSAASSLKESLKMDSNHVFIETIGYNPDPLHNLMRNEVTINLSEASYKPDFLRVNVFVDSSKDDIRFRSGRTLQPMYSSVCKCLDRLGLHVILCRQDHMPLARVPTILFVVQMPDKGDMVEYCSDVHNQLKEVLHELEIPGTVEVSALDSIPDGVKIPCHLGEMKAKFGA